MTSAHVSSTTRSRALEQARCTRSRDVSGNTTAGWVPNEKAVGRTAAHVLQPLDFLVQTAGKIAVCLVLPCKLSL